MSERFITINTVTAQPFEDCGRMLTPRLHLIVSYTTGGMCYFTGNRYSRGYEIAVRHDRSSNEGWVSIIIDGRGNPTAIVEQAARFSQKTLKRIANDVRCGKHNATINALYANAKANRSAYQWPEGIMAKPDAIPSDGFADGGEPYTNEELQIA